MLRKTEIKVYVFRKLNLLNIQLFLIRRYRLKIKTKEIKIHKEINYQIEIVNRFIIKKKRVIIEIFAF
jgi:hypothetical protein